MLIDMLKLFRTVWLAGRPGGGKTSLSIAMALQLVASGYADKICTNTPLTIGTLEAKLSVKDAQQLHDVVTIIDEAWMHLGTSSRAIDRDDWLAYRRHRNQYLILPSVLDLHLSLRHFIVERQFNWMPFGVPLWVYTYNLHASKVQTSKKGRPKADIGKYYWWNPGRVFKYYDHKHNPGDDYYVYTF